MGDRLGPAEKGHDAPAHAGVGDQDEQRETYGSDGVDVRDRVEIQPPMDLGGHIAQLLGRPGVGILVHREGEDHGHQDHDGLAEDVDDATLHDTLDAPWADGSCRAMRT